MHWGITNNKKRKLCFRFQNPQQMNLQTKMFYLWTSCRFHNMHCPQLVTIALVFGASHRSARKNRQFSALHALENHRRRSIMALSVTSALHRFLKPSNTDTIWLKSLASLRRDNGSLRFPPPCWRVRTRVRRRACANHRQGGRDYVNEAPNESQVDTLLWLIYESHKLWLAGRKELRGSVSKKAKIVIKANKKKHYVCLCRPSCPEYETYEKFWVKISVAMET